MGRIGRRVMQRAAQREKRRVAMTSLCAAILLTGTKLGVGLWTNSLGLLSEAAHSGLDLVAAAATLWAVRVADQPADGEHTYGHGKVENLSALFETALLVLTCGWILREAAGRLLGGRPAEVDANAWAFAVVVLSIVVDVSRSRALGRAARRHHSQALEADALHFATDVWSSLVVLVGLGAVRAADAWSVPGLRHADALAAAAVALIVIGVSWRLGRRAVDDLLDAVPRDLPQRIGEAARVPGVLAIRRVRVRRSGAHWFADVTVEADPGLDLGRAHDIANRVERSIGQHLPGADVVVHVEPETAPPVLRAVAPPRHDQVRR